MSDDELKRLLQGLFSDEPQALPDELPPARTSSPAGKDRPSPAGKDRPKAAPGAPDRASPKRSGKRARRAPLPSGEGSPGPDLGTAEAARSQELVRRLWASSQAISAAGDAGQVGQALMQFAAQAGVDVARLLLFSGPEGSPTMLEMRDGWTVDNRPAQPYGTRLPLSSYPLTDFMRADQPAVVEDVTTDPRASDVVRTFMAISGVGSFFIVPLCAGPKWLGALVMGRNGPSAFAGDLIEISWTLAGQAAMVLQYLERMDELHRTLRTLARRDVEQSTLLDNIPDGIYFKDAESRFTRINVYQAGVLLGSSDTEAAVGKTDWDFYAPEFAEQAWNDERQIIESKQPLIGRIEKTIRRSDGQERWVSATKIPLTDDQGEVTGLVGISRDITDLKLAQEQAQHRAAEMQLAAEISKVATGLLDPDQLMQQAVDLIAERFGLYYAGIFLTGDDSKWAVLRAGTGEAGQAMIRAGHRLEVGGRSMIGRCVARAEAGIALDVGAEPFRFDNPLLPNTRSELALPLVSRGRPIGALTIQSTAEAAFSGEDIAALQTMADQLANAVDNARLFQERERRIEELAAVTDIGQAVGSTLDLETLFDTVHRGVSRLFDASSFYIAAYEEGSDEWESAFRLERGERQPKARRTIHGGLTGYVIRTRQPLVFGTRQQYLDFIEAHGLTVIGEPTVSWLAVPLIAADRCVGAMCIQNYDHENLYGERDLAVFSTIAGQVASALENARLFQGMQQRTIEFQALYDVALSMGAHMERHDLLRMIVEQAVALLDAEAGGFYLYDPRAGELTFSVATGYFTDFIGTRLKPGEGLAGQVFQSRTSQAVNDYHTWTSRAGIYDQEVRLHNLLAVPLAGREGVLGVLDIAGGEQAAFTPQDVRLAELFAAQAAVTLENLQLLEDSRQRAAEMEALNKVGQATTAVLDLDGLLGQIVDITKERFGHYFVGIALLEADRLVFRSGSTIGDTGVRLEHWHGVDLASGAGLIAEAARTRQMVLVNDVLADPRYLAVEDLPDTRAEIDAPMEVKGRVIGVLTVQSDRVGAYDQTAVAILQSLASQAGAAIDAAGLFEQAQARARELAVLNDMGRTLTGMLDLDAVIESIRHFASQLVDTTNFFVALYDAEQDMISFPLYIDGEDTRLNMAARRTGKGMSEHVIRTRQSFLVKEDVAGVQAALGIESIGQPSQSWLGVPMMVGEQPIGLISVQSYTTPGVYDEHDRDLLLAVASQAAIAIQNARLFGQQQRTAAQLAERLKQLDCLSDIGRRAQEAPPLPEFLEWVAERIPAAMRHPDVCLAAVEFEGHLYGAPDAASHRLPETGGPLPPEAASHPARPAAGDSELAVPHQMVQSLRIGDETVGRVYVTYPEASPGQLGGGQEFADEESALLGDIVRRVSGYIENRRLLEETEQASRRLAEERALLRTLIDGLPDPTFVKDRNSRFALSNTAHLQALGAASEQEIVGQTDFDRFPQELAAGFYADEQEIMRTGQPLINREEYVVDEQGERRWLWTTKVPLRDEQGRVTGIVGINRDITDRKRAEAVLQRRGAQLECLSDIGQRIGEVLPAPEFLGWVAERIPAAFQYPELCLAAIEFEGTTYGAAEALQQPRQIVQSLRRSNEIVGRLCVAYREERDFLDEESALLGDIARRVSGYIENQRLFEQTQAALAEVEATHRRYLQTQWQSYLQQKVGLQQPAFVFDRSASEHAGPMAVSSRGLAAVDGQTRWEGEVRAAPDLWRPEIGQALDTGAPAMTTSSRPSRPETAGPSRPETAGPSGSGRESERPGAGLAVPIILRGQPIGVLGIEDPDAGQGAGQAGRERWSDEEISLLQEVGQQLALALENARLFEETQRRAERERLITNITARIRSSTDMLGVLETTATELGKALGTSRVVVRLAPETEGQASPDGSPSEDLRDLRQAVEEGGTGDGERPSTIPPRDGGTLDTEPVPDGTDAAGNMRHEEE